MKEELFNKLLGWVNTIEDFTMEQLPLFVEEILTYRAIYHGIWASLLILVFGIAAYLLIKYRPKRDEDGYFEPGELFVSILMWAGELILFLVSVAHIFKFIMVLVAPRLYLIEYVSNLVNGGGC